ncbi:MAG TPA: hypothetical protein DDY58_07675 [Terrisporobacter glycolicus]|uniref:hypothetical protein n=1 Tax=Terrisporobacter TaxID=1505652 RepID=UPI000E80001C|nr:MULTISPECIES: hypothetical protein [Terrisporobacter]HBI92312.1 hypothetical protein [Terrisporobacter hibernicus]
MNTLKAITKVNKELKIRDPKMSLLKRNELHKIVCAHLQQVTSIEEDEFSELLDKAINGQLDMPTKTVKTVESKTNNTNNNDTKICCPKCGSEQLTANKKGFRSGKALAGGMVAGPLGLFAGAIGKDKIEITCLKCGNAFKAGNLK